ncbi:MAG: DnaA N-terminal domain-containing protein, partial [Solirubrobacteraceae bacterium]
MSHAAIAAVLAHEELSAGERLAALSLASFANREHRAFPGTPAAAARAGLRKSGYLRACEQLARAGLVSVEKRGRGRGCARTFVLELARLGPWFDGEVNAELLETVLSQSSTQGCARVLLAVLAALADQTGVVDGFTTEELCRVAGISDTTYRRARRALLESGEVEVVDVGGGRGNVNRWRIRYAGAPVTTPAPPPREPAGPAARALQASVSSIGDGQSPSSAGVVTLRPYVSGVRPWEGPWVNGVSTGSGPSLNGVWGGGRPWLSGVGEISPAVTPAQTPPPSARAGREPQNPVIHPPSPPEGGYAEAGIHRGRNTAPIVVQETVTTATGRRRRRLVAVDPADVCAGWLPAGPSDQGDWQRIRQTLRACLGDSQFEIWLADIELGAVDAAGRLVLVAPCPIRSWVAARFGQVIERSAQRAGRKALIADQSQVQALAALASLGEHGPGAVGDGRAAVAPRPQPGLSPARGPVRRGRRSRERRGSHR